MNMRRRFFGPSTVAHGFVTTLLFVGSVRETQGSPSLGPSPTPTPTTTPTATPQTTPLPIKVSPVKEGVATVALPQVLGGISKEAGALAGVRAVRIDDNEAVLIVQNTQRIVKVGDRIGTDLVKSISAGRVVLLRPPAPGQKGGESLLFVQFDPQGRTQVMVFTTQDTTAKPPVTVK